MTPSELETELLSLRGHLLDLGRAESRLSALNSSAMGPSTSTDNAGNVVGVLQVL